MQPSSSPTLLLPSIVTATQSPVSTLTIAPPNAAAPSNGGGVQIVPVSPPPGALRANANVVTVTTTVGKITETVAASTITITSLIG
jgi:hypothetical protein